MKRMKKLFALLMTLAMVMGLGITGFAAPTDVDTSQDTQLQSNITVTGLSYGVNTDISGYKFATLQYDSVTNEYSWLIADWADPYVDLNDAGTAFEITTGNETALKNAAIGSGTTDTNVTATDISGTSYTFYNVPIGGYILIPEDDDNEADYSPLFAVNTYDRDGSPVNGKPVAETITVAAKSGTHTIVKENKDDFAQIGQSVDYTIRATFPALTSNEGDLKSFVITDTSTGLDIINEDDDDIVVTLGGETLTKDGDYTVTENTQNGQTIVTIAFDDSLFLANNVGKDVVITYSAIVTDVVYNNTASATSSTTKYNSDTTSGKNGSIQITKVDAEDNEVLHGAEFQVYDLGAVEEWSPETPGTLMSFVYDTTKGAYRPALSGETGVTTVKTNETEADSEDGIFKIVGLDEGNYHFVETKAPSGYSINEGGLTVTIEAGDDKTGTYDFEDTKMAALPSTGGMGTTLFTIAGCVIMISAAGLFFASRKRAN